MDVFGLRDTLVRDYDAYVKGFLRIRDPRIESLVHRELDRGLLWPDPLVQVNPAYAPGGTIEQLVSEDVLHQGCEPIFRNSKDEPLRLHKHQEDAIRLARAGRNYVVTTGTGSGKSLTYIIPIVDQVLRQGSGGGIKALIVYPMNALANSQLVELGKFIKGESNGQVTYARYTGQESKEEREKILENPPDILLTNYVMLELILTRVEEKKIVDAAKGLRFFVLDELHTYRGRQGADVAMLIRRARESFHAPEMQCVGTSATLVDPEADDPADEVAKVASLLFGAPVLADQVVQETLRRVTPDLGPDAANALKTRLTDRAKAYEQTGYSFVEDPLSSWIESTLGLARDHDSLPWRRATPKPLSGPQGLAAELAKLTGAKPTDCEDLLKTHLVKGYESAAAGDEAARAFAFRLHQFLSRGGTPYATLEPENSRFITLSGGARHPEDLEKRLYPLAFCRECGQEYYVGRIDEGKLLPRDFSDVAKDEETELIYAYVSTDRPWDESEQLDRVPPDWIEEGPKGPRVKSSRKENLPRNAEAQPDGTLGAGGTRLAILSHPFRFCLQCGVSYNPRLRSDYQKLLSLDREARSSATTVLTQSALLGLHQAELDDEARKLLSFTDNRQDASLQSGHFNDFNEVGALRSALYHAVNQAGEGGLRDDKLTEHVLDALNLHPDAYTLTPGLKYGALEEAKETFKSVLGYRIYRDLERGWRITSPNLEQAGLLRIDYAYLNEVCTNLDDWKDAQPALRGLMASTRQRLARALLDFLRHELCIRTPYLDYATQNQIKTQSQMRLKERWAIDSDELMERSRIAFPRPGSDEDRGGDRLRYITPRSNFGQFLKNEVAAETGARPKEDEAQAMIQDIFKALATAGLLQVVEESRDPSNAPGYQVAASQLLWLPGDGTKGAVDVLRTPFLEEAGARTNPFFVSHYRERAAKAANLRSAAHTAQVRAADREEREKTFRTGELPLLFCSPTMELGVDINQLNVVNLRNVPPTPANYAQRSGRAGRGGQPALVFTYCSRFSPHDQYFFRRREEMVAGSVAPPSIDLTNEDLIRSHVQAVWLSESNLDLGTSLTKLIETEHPEHHLEVKESVQGTLQNETVRRRALERAKAILRPLEPLLQTTPWYHETWTERAIHGIQESFERAVLRWKTLLRNAEEQSKRQEERVRRTTDKREHEQARRLLAEAQSQIRLLKNIDDADADWLSDFYSYRYFASEGFLPGYNFPRLPVSAYIPGRPGAKRSQGYVNRPRFIAINEFGPRSIIYHEGSTYRIVKAHRPPESADSEDSFQKAKVCGECGYVHPITDELDPDVCESCGAELKTLIPNLFRLEAVTTQRARRITSDEEERRRIGFDVLTALQYNAAPGKTRSAGIIVNGQPWGRLVYSPNADVWRINLGERRRRVKSNYGFMMDMETGYWSASQQDDTDEENAGMVTRPRPVVPYVTDHTNCLTFVPQEPLPREQMATLQAALKIGIQRLYQIEDRELSVEPLPSKDVRNRLLFWESSEGGAGVLRQLAEQPNALALAARLALDSLHFDPATGEDRPPEPGREPCGGACYECVLSYFNQPDHGIVDRRLVRDVLQELAGSTCESSPTAEDRKGHYERLLAKCDTDGEREWLQLVYERGLRLPTFAQHGFEGDVETKPDFTYADPPLLVYIDGSVHDTRDVAARDARRNAKLRTMGVSWVQFREDQQAQWEDQMRLHRGVFGGHV